MIGMFNKLYWNDKNGYKFSSLHAIFQSCFNFYYLNDLRMDSCQDITHLKIPCFYNSLIVLATYTMFDFDDNKNEVRHEITSYCCYFILRFSYKLWEIPIIVLIGNVE